MGHENKMCCKYVFEIVYFKQNMYLLENADWVLKGTRLKLSGCRRELHNFLKERRSAVTLCQDQCLDYGVCLALV